MMGLLVAELAAEGIPVVVSCRVLTLARQPYYRWLKSPVGARELSDAYLANALFDAHRDDPEFSYQLLADEARAAGHTSSDRRVWRLCSANRWLNMAVARRGPVPGCIVHSDRGSQFRSKRFLATLRAHRLVGSMGQISAAGDNTAMESFFGLLQNNVLNQCRWTTR